MKMNQMILPLVLVLAATLATTGCKHKPVKVTTIYGSQGPVVSDNQNPGTLNSGQPINPEPSPGVNSNLGPIATATGWDPSNFIRDQAALAANTIHFAFDSAVIKKHEDANIATVASALSANAGDKLLIEGNCDERGTEEYNRALGERRALAAREALV